MNFSTIIVNQFDKVTELQLNRPHKLNAITVQMLSEASEAIDRAIDSGSRALLIGSTGPAFSAGLDLEEANARQVAGSSENVLDEYFAPFAGKLANLPIPIVSAISGAAIGGGCAIALSADIMIAGKSAYFQCPFVNLGLVPDTGVSWLIARAGGRAQALEILMLGERFSAEEAHAAGLITRTVDHEELLRYARDIAIRLAQGPTVALGLIRRQVASALTFGFEEMLTVESRNQTIAANTDDVKESLTAFAERRRPVFSGR